MRFPFRSAVAFVALALVAAACSSNNAAETTTSTTTTTTSTTTTTTTVPTTTTTRPPTTTTTEPPMVVAGTINGLAADDDTLEDRRVVAVKIDNHPKARPQSGLETADAVYEILVEGGLTRFIALFHQSDSEFVGPNRSGRPTDASVVKPLQAPFQISGAQPWVKTIFRDKGIHVVYDNGFTTFRMPHRPAPHNLYTTTESIRQYADDEGWPDEAPPPLFIYGEPSEADATAETITFDWSGQPNVIWTWDGEKYLRFNADEPHVWVDADALGDQVSADTLVVIKGRRYTARGSSGSSVPAIEIVGDGEALVFHSGGVLGGTWERGSEEEMIRIFDLDGNEIVIAPGRVWINIFPDDRTISWE